MDKKTNVMSGLTEYGSKRIDEILESTSTWMGPESTIGDFFTAFFDEVVEEVLGEEICSMTILDLEKEENRKKALDRLFESSMFSIFVQAYKAEQLM